MFGPARLPTRTGGQRRFGLFGMGPGGYAKGAPWPGLPPAGVSRRRSIAAMKEENAPTPMMAQYIEIKAANPDSLLFYRMGDFYELFFDDAAVASRALGIALTRRGKHQGEDIPMCGVPVVSSDDYLQRLIGLGHRVAVCEQLEDPAEARKRGGKSPVRRDVVRLVTPGTITEERLLDPGKPNYLMSLARLGGSGPHAEFAQAWADLSTGQFTVKASAADRLATDMLAVDPSEIIVADTVFHDPQLKPLFTQLRQLARPEPAVLFDAATASARLCRFYDVATLDGFGEFGRAELAAAAALLAYLSKTQFAARPALQRPERMGSNSVMLIDPATRTSLELTRSTDGKRQGSLLATIDRTATGKGEYGGNRLNAQLAGNLGVLVDIDLDQPDGAGLFVDHFFKRRGQCPAWTAPRGPEVDQDGRFERSVDNVDLEGLIGGFLDQRARGH